VNRKNELPKDLLTAPLSAKIVWLYLKQYGTVSFSRRQLVEVLGLSPVTLHQAFERLEPFLNYQRRCIGRHFVYSLRGRETEQTETQPRALPDAIRTSTPGVKAVYLWQLLFGEAASASVRDALRISNKTMMRVQTVLEVANHTSVKTETTPIDPLQLKAA
jgi:hypothetical protein